VTKKDEVELRRRLKRLGRGKSRSRKSSASRVTHSKGLPDGEIIDTSYGQTYRIVSMYDLDHLHGNNPLSHALSFPTSLTADVARRPELADVPVERLLFLDTETTGLAGGAGTLTFLVGVGYFEENKFHLNQYFLRDPIEEMGMLDVLQGDIEKSAGFVTYNGQTFDLPILENRYIIALRRQLPLLTSPNLDLLYLTRRLWSKSLPDCTLSTVENHVLGVKRSEADVPGSWIPGMYLDYLRTGDASEMGRIIYHNLIDILSLVSLTGEILKRFEKEDMISLSGSEALAVARWHQDSGRGTSAEEAFQRAVSSTQVELRLEALRRYTTYLKRDGRRSEAVSWWIMWHELDPSDDRPCVELAKYYEWELQDLGAAYEWSQQALQCLTHWPADWRRDRAWKEIENRLSRLSRKLSLEDDDSAK
jgi:uncharacterized protein YprB with RNaseH-like and TPR domain